MVVKQNDQTEQQAGVAYANLLLTEQGQELIVQAGFVKIRWHLSETDYKVARLPIDTPRTLYKRVRTF